MKTTFNSLLIIFALATFSTASYAQHEGHQQPAETKAADPQHGGNDMKAMMEKCHANPGMEECKKMMKEHGHKDMKTKEGKKKNKGK